MAQLILATGLDGLPPAVGQVMGGAGWDVVNALADIKDDFDRHAWLAGNTEWLARAVAPGPAGTRAVLGRRGHPGVGPPGRRLADAPWPEPQVPDLDAFFRSST